MSSRLQTAERVFLSNNGILRMSKALQSGISRRTLYEMRDSGRLEQVSRGLYRLTGIGDLGFPDIIAATQRIPDGVVCLVSALAFHELTTLIPCAVDIAIERGKRAPKISHPPVEVHHFTGDAFTQGIEEHSLDGEQVSIYGAEKTIADLFKFRNKIGLDVAMEALKTWRRRPGVKFDTLLGYARICRVESVMRPYLEILQ